MAIRDALLTERADDYICRGQDSGVEASGVGLHREVAAGGIDAAEARSAAGHGAGTPASADAVPLRASIPVPSAGIHPGLVPWIVRDFGVDVVVNAGGGIHGHPMGTAAGGRAFRQAIDAVMSGAGLTDYARNHPELAAAIERWGAKA